MRDHARGRPQPGIEPDETRIHDPAGPEWHANDDARAGGPRGTAPRREAPDGARIERVEERLAPRVRRARAGSLRIQRRTVEEPDTVEVALRHDELHLERRPVDRPLAAGEMPVTERGDTTVILVVEERLEVRRVPWVVEEIHVQRELVTERRAITDTVRRQRIDIDSQGDVELTNAET